MEQKMMRTEGNKRTLIESLGCLEGGSNCAHQNLQYYCKDVTQIVIIFNEFAKGMVGGRS